MKKDTSKYMDRFVNYAACAVCCNFDYELDLQFYLTQKCDLACSGCYVGASPRASGNVLPKSDVEFYLKEFENVPRFTHSVVLTGGEIFTTPIVDVEWIAHQVLDRGWWLQLKTNGAWIHNQNKSKAVLSMLRRLQPARGLLATEEQINDFLAKKPKWLLRFLGPDVTHQWVYSALPTVSLLSVVVSVDNVLHPKKSVQWFKDIVAQVGKDKRLKKNIDLKTFSVMNSKNFYVKNIINSPECVVKEQKKGGNLIKYELNGVPVESYFGKYIDVKKISEKDKIESFVLPPLGNSLGRLVYCFYPDKTVGLDSCYLQAVGRVSYLKQDGSRKTFNEIRSEIFSQLIKDYQKAIKK